jgi:hypothetical protein
VAAEQVRVDLDPDDIFAQANDVAMLRARVLAKATDVVKRARRIDGAEHGGQSTFSIDERVLPNGRYICLVGSDDADGEHGTASTPRRRTLRRAAGAP